MSRWFVSTIFMIYVHDFPHGEVSMEVSIMEFGLYQFTKKLAPQDSKY